MKFNPDHCPTCGKIAYATCDNVPGLALLMSDPATSDEFEYAGETELDWDGQTKVTDEDGKVCLCCADRHTWWADQAGIG